MNKLKFSIFLVMAIFSINVMVEANYLKEILSDPENRWMVRLRAVYLQMDQRSYPIPNLGVPRDAIEIKDIFISELDISFFFTKYIAAEIFIVNYRRNIP